MTFVRVLGVRQRNIILNNIFVLEIHHLKTQIPVNVSMQFVCYCNCFNEGWMDDIKLIQKCLDYILCTYKAHKGISVNWINRLSEICRTLCFVYMQLCNLRLVVYS